MNSSIEGLLRDERFLQFPFCKCSCEDETFLPIFQEGSVTIYCGNLGSIVVRKGLSQDNYRYALHVGGSNPKRRGGRGGNFIRVTLDGGAVKTLYFHRLVYDTFIQKLEEGDTVGQKDGDRLHNCVYNLEKL